MTVINSKKKKNQADVVPSRSNVYEMFDRISRRYDLLNRLLSFGFDMRWRRKAVKLLPKSACAQVVDLACGTADMMLAARSVVAADARIIGIDKSLEMLKIGRRKLLDSGFGESSVLIRGDGHAIPLADNSVDAVIIAFGIRNMEKTEICLREIVRILQVAGRLIVLEFSLPRNRFLRKLYLVYFRHLLPRIGALISGDPDAYRYLNQTVETFYQGDDFAHLMSAAGFVDVTVRPVTFGVASIYSGVKA